jgi:hypothetical protein
MSARTDVLLWAQRVVARQTAPAYQILEISASCTLDVAQDAFHKIARLAHPDLHRTTLTPDELELVTQAYSRAAAAYQELRMQKRTTMRMQPLTREPSGPIGVTGVPPSPVIPTSPSAHKAPTIPPLGPVHPAQAMSSRALIYYRKAELSLRRGELTAAVLQLKMAIASDPQSQFLRSALSEVETELAKKP